MENQINIGDQNNQQIGQNSVSQAIQAPEKPKINYWMISTFVLFLLLVVSVLSNTKTRNERTKKAPITPNVVNEPTPLSSEKTILCEGKRYTSSDKGVEVVCPIGLKLIECDKIINFIEPDSSTDIPEYCSRSYEGVISIGIDPLYDINICASPSGSCKEEMFMVGNIKATKQTRRYIGANEPRYSTYVTFSKNSHLYYIRVLDENLVSQFNSIISTLKFIVSNSNN